MSKFVQYESCIDDQQALIEALGEVGYKKVEVHPIPATLYGYHGDARPERANVIVRRTFIGSASNDLGFLRRADGKFQAIISDFDRQQHGEAWLNDLAQKHGVAKVKRFMKQNGDLLVSEEIVKDKSGRKEIRLRAEARSTNARG